MKLAKFFAAILALCLLLSLFTACDSEADSSSANNDQEQNGQQNDNLTDGQRTALEKAKSYLDYSAFSREALIEQLKLDDLAESDILFATDNIGADWNAQCLKKAKSYLKYSALSKQELTQRLKADSFTDEEIAYAITEIGESALAGGEQEEDTENNMTPEQKAALDAATAYLEASALSRQELVDKLTTDGLAESDIIFAADNIDWNAQCLKKAEVHLDHTTLTQQDLIDQLKADGFTSEEIAYAMQELGYTSSDDNQGTTTEQDNALAAATAHLAATAFSRQGLIAQLELDGFEASDAIFAVDNVEVDWNEQCSRKAGDYISDPDFPMQDLMDLLASDGFTSEQIAYAVEMLGG